MASEKKTYEWKDATHLGAVVVRILLIGNLVMLAGLAVSLRYGAAAAYDAKTTSLSEAQTLKMMVDTAAMVVTFACISVPVWIWRVSSNAHVLKPNMRFSPLGAIGFYLVPVASLFLPFQAMVEIWRVSTGRADRDPPEPAPQLMWAWWWCLLGNNTFAVLALFRLKGEQAAQAEMAAIAFGILSSVFLIQIVREVTAGLRARTPGPARGWVV